MKSESSQVVDLRNTARDIRLSFFYKPKQQEDVMY